MGPSETNRQQSVASSSKPRIITCAGLADFEDRIRKTIAYRAYEMYESRGRGDGSDMSDWFSAERELVKPGNVSVTESDGSVQISAEVEGFENIQVGISPTRIILWGDGAATGTGEGAHLLGEIALPAAVDPDHVAASVQEGVFQFRAPKAKHAAA